MGRLRLQRESKAWPQVGNQRLEVTRKVGKSKGACQWKRLKAAGSSLGMKADLISSKVEGQHKHRSVKYTLILLQ